MTELSDAVVDSPARGPGRASAWRRVASALLIAAFVVYLVGLLVWLTLGLLPTIAHDIPPVGAALHEIAEGTGSFATLAGRVLGIDAAELMSSQGAWVQYAFSLLNLALGLVLAVRGLDRLVPCLLAFALLGTAATFNDVSHRAFHITGSPWPVSIAHFTFHVVSGVAYFWAVVLFPDGRLPRRLWVPQPWRGVAVATVTAGIVAVCWRSSFLQHPQFFVVFFGIVVPLAGAAVQWVRLADPATTPAEESAARLLLGALLPALVVALSWLAAHGAALVGGLWPAVMSARLELAFPVVFALVPVVLTAGVIRYRWWDLDRVVVRVLVYGLIALGVGLVYLLAVFTGSALAGGGLWWLIVVLALATAAVEPVRRWATRWANRVVYGQVLSPEAALRMLVDGFETLASDATLGQVETAAVSATRASAASLWLVDGNMLVPATGHAAPKPWPAPGDPATHLGAAACWPVSYQGEVLGQLAVTVPRSVQLTPGDRDMLGDLAGHAGLVVHNALLSLRLVREIDVLAERSADLTAARRRLVEAQDAERRRLERDLHDGAQQAVVAAIIGMRTVDAAPDPAVELASLAEVLAVGRQWLVDLAVDGPPAVLTEYGLGGALERAAGLVRRGGPAVTVTVQVRSPVTDAHVAAYYCCVEALQNVAKYSRARHVTVDVLERDATLAFAVTDDGAGFDPADADRSGGLASLVQRCALLGGSLAVESMPGAGTRLDGRIPVPAADAAGTAGAQVDPMAGAVR